LKLEIGKIYNGWKYSGLGVPSKCDKCGLFRRKPHEFVHPDTPIGDSYGEWNGFKYADEPLNFGSECVKQFIKQ
jgi:hypothetical protein